ncbi:MAG TPA: isoprenylcysteine carboxylmethyltransferase family protein [Verrucomicrobiae bacterium]
MKVTPSQSSRRWVMAQTFLLLALVASGPLGRDYERVWGVTVELGVILFGIGAYLGIAGVRHLGQNRTPYPEPLADGELITAGIYKRLRHPLYASLVYCGFGWALLWNSSAAFIMAAITACYLHAKARCEERFLLKRYPDYSEYMKKTARYLPGIY